MASFGLGFIAGDMQHYIRQDNYRLAVVKVIAPRKYEVLIWEEDKQDWSVPRNWQACSQLPDPGFEESDWIDVTFEKTSDVDGGTCMDLYSPHMGFVAVPGHAKHREEATWITTAQ